MNGTTWLDRTNYFETLPSHQLELALWLEADRMGTLLDALSQENLDNQREVVKNEKRWSYDNRPYGSLHEKLQGHLFPADHPYHHSTIGSMEDLDAASLEDVSAFFRTYYAPNNAVLSVVGDVDTGRRPGRCRALLRRRSRPTRPSRRSATCRCRRRSAASAARPSSTRSRCRASTSASGRRSSATRGSTRSTSPARSWPAARAAGSTGGSSATSGSPRTSRSSRSGSSAAPRSCAGWATVRPGVAGRARRGGAPRGARAARDRARQRRRAGPGQGADRDRGARRAPAGRGAGRPAVDVRDAVRRPGPDQPDAAALPGGDGGGDPRGRGGRVPAGQPGRPDLPARRLQPADVTLPADEAGERDDAEVAA